MIKEKWKTIKGYDSLYAVSTLGNIRSMEKTSINGNLLKPKMMKPARQSNGYISLVLHNNGFRKTHTVHRLVAVAFLKNPNNLKTVNHKNGKRDDNSVDNLEWMSQSDNCKHGFEKNGHVGSWTDKFGKDHHRSKVVIQMDLDSNEVARFYGTMEVERETGINNRGVADACRGKNKTAGGFKWKYLVI